MSFPNLLSPYSGKGQQYQNRIVMAALTRQRAGKLEIPNDIMLQYYGMRGDCGLILTEASQVQVDANSFPEAGGIYNEEQVEGWKKITDAVHAKGAKIVIQVCHGGRSITSDILNGLVPICPSPVLNKFKPNYVTPREMNQEDFQNVLQQFTRAAVYAKKAGFDGIQLHGANGFLIDQFLRDNVNQRTDEYGGSVEGRCKFPLQILDKFCEVFEPQNVGIKISPVGRYNDMFDSDPLNLYSYLIQQLNERKIGFIEVMEATELFVIKEKIYPSGDEQIPDVCGVLRPLFNGVYIANNGLSLEKGEELIQQGKCDLVSYGRFFISNPDLVERIKNGWELNKNADPKTFFTPGVEGYLDYPVYAEWKKSQ